MREYRAMKTCHEMLIRPGLSGATTLIFLIILSVTATAQNDGSLAASKPGIRSHLNFLGELSWASSYVSEGRNNLDGGDLASGLVHMDIKALHLDIWYAEGYSSNYNEVNFSATLFNTVGSVSGYLSATHLRFPQDKATDNEVAAGLSYELPVAVTVNADWVYSVEAGGSFIELSVGTALLEVNNFTLEPQVHLGLNAGYIPDGHNGLNNILLQLDGIFSFAGNYEFVAFVAYTQGVNRNDLQKYPDDAFLKDFGFAGGTLRVTL